MNKKGFTLVEVLSVIILLGLLMSLAGVGVIRAQTKAREKTLATKVKNIENAAVLYGQNHRNEFDTSTSCEYCKDNNSDLPNCYCFNKIININELVNEGLIKSDTITNSVDESKNLSKCEIQIYSKYGKIYAVYTKQASESDVNTKCWK